MGYYNPIYIYGVDQFLADAKAAGVDGLIVVDLPPEEDEELCLPALKAGLNFIRLATPTTDDKRLPAVLTNTSGFVYYVSITGITGAAAPDAGKVDGRGRAHQAPHQAAGRGRLRRAHRRAGARHRRRRRRRRGRLGAGRCGAGQPRQERQGDAGTVKAVADLVSELAARRARGPPRRRRIAAPAVIIRQKPPI